MTFSCSVFIGLSRRHCPVPFLSLHNSCQSPGIRSYIIQHILADKAVPGQLASCFESARPKKPRQPVMAGGTSFCADFYFCRAYSSSASKSSSAKLSSVALSSSTTAFPVAEFNRTCSNFPGFPAPLLKRRSFSQSISPTSVIKLTANPCVKRFPNLVRRTSYSFQWVDGYSFIALRIFR